MDLERYASLIQEICIQENALQKIPEIMSAVVSGPRPLMICDDNTYGAAGKTVEDLVSEHFPLKKCYFENSPLPNEEALGTVLLRVEEDINCLLSVGSGTLTDLTRFVASRTDLPFLAVATAPSMDGYASSGCSLLIRGIKTTVSAKLPSAIIADVAILSAAPEEMKAAGFGDLHGKMIAKVDWYLGQAINDELVHEGSLDMVQETYDKVQGLLEADAVYSPEMLQRLMEGLIVSGLSMVVAGVSRPASGGDHQISHFLGLRSNIGSAPVRLHGQKVAVGAALMTRLYHSVFSQSYAQFQGCLKKAFAAETREQREQRLKRAYGPLAEERIGIWRSRLPQGSRVEAVLKRLSQSWKALQDSVQRYIPLPKELEAILTRARVPFDGQELGFDPQDIEDAMICAKEINQKYTLLSLLDELGLLEYFADRVLSAYHDESAQY